MDAEAFHDLSPVAFDRLEAHAEALCDVLAGVAFGHELQNLPLPRRQRVERIAAPPMRRA